MNRVEQRLIHTLQTAIQKAKLPIDVASITILIDIPKEKKNGDYASNIALQLSKQLKQNPRTIADQIVTALDLSSADLERVEIAGPGFINFFVKTGSLAGIIETILDQKETFGQTTFGKGIRYNVEFVSANPTGDLHLGHARQAALGDSICRLLKAAGYHVTREYYVNDAGNQIHNLTLSIIARYHEACGVDYTFPADGYHGADIIAIAHQLKEEVGTRYVNDTSKEAYQFFRQRGIALELAKIKRDLEAFRTSFDTWTSETAIREAGTIEKTLSILRDKGFLYEQEGATWFRSSAFGDDKDRVLIKSDGSYTYVTPDIAYHLDKYARGHDYLVNLLGADHHGYISRMKAAIMALGHNADQLEIDIVQMVRLLRNGEEFKMSKRSGNAVTLRELCEEVGVDAVRYFFVNRPSTSHLDFDLDLATKQSNENPVYYAQYAHARMCSIHELAERKGIKYSTQGDLLVTPKEVDLLKVLHEFPDMIVSAAKDRSPNQVTIFIQRLAQLFHAFYNECYVLDDAQPALSEQRLGLVEAVRIVLKNALTLIGVEAPTKMEREDLSNDR